MGKGGLVGGPDGVRVGALGVDGEGGVGVAVVVGTVVGGEGASAITDAEGGGGAVTDAFGTQPESSTTIKTSENKI